MNKKILAIILVLVAVIVLGGTVTYVFCFAQNGENSATTPTPTSNQPTQTLTPTPTLEATPQPTLTSTPAASVSPTPSVTPSPTPPAPAVNVNMDSDVYNSTLGQYTTFVCTIKINNPTYNSLLTSLEGNMKTSLQGNDNVGYSFGNYASQSAAGTFGITGVSDGQFTLTLTSYNPTSVDENNIVALLTRVLNGWLTANSP
jgi:hypothetical protein